MTPHPLEVRTEPYLRIRIAWTLGTWRTQVTNRIQQLSFSASHIRAWRSPYSFSVPIMQGRKSFIREENVLSWKYSTQQEEIGLLLASGKRVKMFVLRPSELGKVGYTCLGQEASQLPLILCNLCWFWEHKNGVCLGFLSELNFKSSKTGQALSITIVTRSLSPGCSYTHILFNCSLANLSLP